MVMAYLFIEDGQFCLNIITIMQILWIYFNNPITLSCRTLAMANFQKYSVG